MSKTVRCNASSQCFTALCQIRCSVPLATLSMLVVALVHSWLDYGNSMIVGLPAYQTSRLQSVLNAAAWLIYRLRTHNHISDALISQHWLRVPEQIQYKLAVLAEKVLHGDAPRYLGLLTRVDDLPGWQTPIKLSTVGSRAFAVAAPHIWNTLSTDVNAASSLSTFRRLLKISYLAVISWHHLMTVVLAVVAPLRPL